MLGEWVRRRGIREEMVIIDKGAHTRAGQKRLTPADITADLHEGLSRLGTDYIDLYLLHRDDPAMGVGPIVEVLNEYLSAGRIRAFGGSNWTAGRIAEANDYAAAHARPDGFRRQQPPTFPWPSLGRCPGPEAA